MTDTARTVMFLHELGASPSSWNVQLPERFSTTIGEFYRQIGPGGTGGPSGGAGDDDGRVRP